MFISDFDDFELLEIMKAKMKLNFANDISVIYLTQKLIINQLFQTGDHVLRVSFDLQTSQLILHLLLHQQPFQFEPYHTYCSIRYMLW